MPKDYTDWSLDAWKPWNPPAAGRLVFDFSDTVEAAPFRDPALQPGFRVKGPDELPGFNKTQPMVEENRFLGAVGKLADVADFVGGGIGGTLSGAAQGGVALVGGITDTGTRIVDNIFGTDIRSPVNRWLMNWDRQIAESGESNASWFMRNVSKSATKMLGGGAAGAGIGAAVGGPIGAAVGAPIGIAASYFLEPAHQQYMAAREKGVSPKVALTYGVAHGAVESAVQMTVERFLPGAGKAIGGAFAKALANDVVDVVAPAVAQTMVKSAMPVGRIATSEGIEEALAFAVGDQIDKAYQAATGADLRPDRYESGDPNSWMPNEAWWRDLRTSTLMGMAAGGLIAGGINSLRGRQFPNSDAEIAKAAGTPPQPAQTLPNPALQDPTNAPKQPTPLADPTLPVQPTGASQPAAIDPGQGAQPQVTQPFGNPEQLADPNQFPEPAKMVEPTVAQQPGVLPELPRTERDQPDPSTLFDREMATIDRANPDMSFTKSAVTNLPPEVVAKIAELPNASRGAFAQAMGVKKVGQLPVEFSNQKQREYAVKIARKVQDFAKQQAERQQPVPEKTGGVFDVMERLEPGAVRNGTLLPVRDVRAEFPNLTKEQFDAGILRMSREGKVSLHRHDHVSSLSPEERDQLITDGEGNYYVGMAVRGSSGINPGPMADAPLESRGAPASVLNQATGSSSKGMQGAVGTPTNQNFGPSKTDRRTTIRDVTDSMLQAAEMIVGGRIPVGESSFPKKPGQKGQFHPKDRDVRVDTRNNLPTTAHELGHAMETSGSKSLNPPVGSKARMDVWRLGKKQGYAPMVEGPAEFIRLYVQEGPAGAQKEAPHLYEHFVKTMQAENPRALKKLDEAAERYNILTREMGPVDRLKSQIADPRETNKGNTRKAWEDTWNWFVGNFLDSAEVVGRMKAESKRWSKSVLGREIAIPKHLDPANWLVMLHGLAASRTKSAVEGSPVNWDGQESGRKGLRDILSPLGGKGEAVDDFNAYLYARRSIASQDPQHLDRINAARKAVFGPDTPDIKPMRTGVTLKDARHTILELEGKYNGQNGAPDFNAMSLEYYQFWDGVLSYMGEASPTLRQQVAAIRAGDPGFYTPLMREIDAADAPAPVRSAASGQIGRRRRGSDRAVIDPLTQAVKVLEARYTTAHQRVFLESIIALGNVAKTPAWGMGEFIKKLEPGMSPSDGKATFDVFERGKMETYQVNDEGVMRALQSLDPVSFAGLGVIGQVIDKLLVNPASTLKKFATVYNPRFGLITQTVFAYPEMLAVGASFADPYKAKEASNILEATWRRGKNYASMTKDFALNTLHIFLDAVSGGKLPPLLTDVADAIEGYKRDGQKFETSIRNDDAAAYELSRWAAGKGLVQIAQEDGAGGVIRWMLNAVPNYAQNVIGSVQEGAALATYQATLQRLGLSVNDPKTTAQRMQIAEAVKEGTGNYARRGIAARYLEKVMPYSTAGLVHGASLVRAMKNDPANVATVWGLGLLASIAAVALAMEDEEYREADASQKVKYAHFKTADGWILLPAYSEFGLSTHGLAVSLVHAMYGDKDAFSQLREMVKTLSLSYVPASWNPAIAEVASQAMNRDVRTGQPLVPNYRDKRDGDKQPTVVSDRKPSDQFTDKTTPVAKIAGKLTGVSPMRIEHAADTLTGRQFSNVQKMVTGEKSVAQGIGPISREAGNLSAKDEATDRLYDSIRKANEIKADPKGGESAEQRDTRLMLESADRARDAWSALQRASKDPDKIKEYAAKKREVSRVAVEQYDNGDSSKSAFAVQERVASVLLAKEWDQPEEVAKLVANGVDDLTRGRQPKIADQKELERQQEEAKQFIKAAGLSNDEVLSLYDQHTKATQDKQPADKRDSLESLAGRRRRLQQNLER